MKRIMTFLAALVLCMSMAQPAWAASETYVDSSLRTGDIRIGISDALDLGDRTTVLPGDEIDYSVSVENRAEPAWIRVRITELPDWLDMDNVKIADGWDPHGEYYYYKNIAGSDQTVKFIEGVTIPDTLGNEMQGAEFIIKTSAEAVQSEHFEPDFGSEDPWFGTVIEVCTDSDPYSNPGKDSLDPFQVIYENGSQGLIHVGDDFFAEWDRLMPGDVMTGTVEIKNSYLPVTVYFRTENILGEDGLIKPDAASDTTLDTDAVYSSDLLFQLNLKIENVDGEESTVIYDGPMSGVASPTSLGEYVVGSSTVLKYTVTMPKQLQNAYSLKDTVTRWIFSVESSGQSAFELPRTGGPGVIGYMAAGASCTALAAVCVLVRKKGGAAHD